MAGRGVGRAKTLASGWQLAVSLAFTCMVFSTVVRAEDAPAAVVGGEVITSKDVDAVVDAGYRNAAVRRLVRQVLLDEAARKAGVTVTDAEVDTFIAQMKAASFGNQDDLYRASLAQQGLTPQLYREVVRQNMLVEQTVSRSTQLDDADFDSIQCERLIVHSAEQAQAIYLALRRGFPLVQVMRNYETGVETVNTFLLRYDPRVDARTLDQLFAMKPASFNPPVAVPPTPATDTAGYQILLATGRNTGTAAERKFWSDDLLKGKIKVKVQEFWSTLENRVDAALAAKGSTGAAANANPGAPAAPGGNAAGAGGAGTNNTAQAGTSGAANVH